MLCTPPHPDPFLCLWVRVSVWACVRTSPVPSLPQPPTPTLKLLPFQLLPAVTRLSLLCPCLQRGKKGGWQGRSPTPARPHPPPPPLPEVPAVVRVGVTVFCDNHSVGELATRQALHGFLAVKHRGELHEDLWNKRQIVKARWPLHSQEGADSQQPPASTQARNS